MKYNWQLILGVAYIFFITGMVVGEVGNIPECTNEPYDYWFPVKIFFIFGGMFFWGWLAARDHYKENN